MDKRMCNAEGYIDPTAGMAILNIEKEKKKWMPLVYICFADTGDMFENIKLARKYSRFAVEREVIPVATDLMFSKVISRTNGSDFFVVSDNAVFRRTEELWVFGNDTDEQMAKKIAKAEKMEKSIRYFSDVE